MARRAALLPLISAAALFHQSFSNVALGDESGGLAARRARIAQLRWMVRSPAAGAKQRAARLLRLATLHHEVAILRGDQGAADLTAAATTCRQLLVTYPSSREEAEALLLLARVELRRGDHQAVLDASTRLSALPGKQRCEGWLLAAAAQTALSAHDVATAIYRRVLADSRCLLQRSLTDEATYLLGWSLIRRGEASKAAGVFRRLLSRELAPLLRGRVLEDLALAWSTERPDPSAATLLVQLGGTQHGWPLVRQVAERLAAQGRSLVLQRFAARALELGPPLDVAAALWRLRLRAARRSASLLSLLAQLRRSPVELRRRLRSQAAAILLDMAEHRDERLLYQAVVRDYGDRPAAAIAHQHLGTIEQRRGSFEQAAVHFEKAAQLATSKTLQQQARYQQVYSLQQQLVSDKAVSHSRRFCAAAERYLRDHARSGEAATVRLALAAEHLARRRAAAALALVMTSRVARVAEEEEDRRRRAAIAMAAAEQLERWELVYQLSSQQLERCRDDEPGAPISERSTGGGTSCAALRHKAHAAALRRSAELAARRGVADARRWAQRAAEAAPTAAARWNAHQFAARLAVRSGALREADRLLASLVGDDVERSEGGRPPSRRNVISVVTMRAELATATGRFRGAAALYAAAADQETSLTGRLEQLTRAATAWLHARDRSGASREVHKLQRALKRGAADKALSPLQQARWALRVGELLSRCDSGRAYRYLVRSAHNVPPRFPRAVARLLLAAADNAPRDSTRRALLQRALTFAGPLRRGGRTSEVAVTASLKWAATQRALLAARQRTGRLASAALTQFAASLAPLLQLQDLRWTPEAAGHLAWAFGALAERAESRSDEPAAPDSSAAVWREKQRRVRLQLAALARRQDGLCRHTLAATGGAIPRLVDGLDSASTAPAKAVRSMLASGRWEAALAASEKALALAGDDAALRCARSVALLITERPEAAWQELVAAVRLDSSAACARRNLVALARKRGDAELAAQVINNRSARIKTAAAAAAR